MPCLFGGRCRRGTIPHTGHLKEWQLQLSAKATRMSRRGYVYALTFALVLTGALSGCAVYRRCGFRGCPGDANITAEVWAGFDQHPALGPPNLLHVQTLDHVVYLSGQVATDLQREIAESVALEATGGARIVNSIALSYEGR